MDFCKTLSKWITDAPSFVLQDHIDGIPADIANAAKHKVLESFENTDPFYLPASNKEGLESLDCFPCLAWMLKGVVAIQEKIGETDGLQELVAGEWTLSYPLLNRQH